MKISINHYGIVKDGRKIYHNQSLYDDQLRQLEGKPFVEVIKEVHKKPSHSQYGYYRGGILIACHQSEEFSHYDKKDDIHDEYFAPKYLSYTKLIDIDGNKYEITMIRSLADLSQDEMSLFMTKVLADCDQKGIVVLSPADYYSKFYNK